MTKYIIMGNYTAKAFQGFIKDPNQDRSTAVKALTAVSYTHLTLPTILLV